MRYHMDSAFYASMLYDFYGALLSDAQKDVMSLYHENNLSLSEIAEELGQTRQAVHYTLKKAEASLEEYEEKLRLVATYENNQELAQKAADIVAKSEIEEGQAYELLTIIKKLAE
ncbi:MAG: YlxM family DNA-binding protein [Mogibacterium sp.]|nr:YlxM family DNA-binding protein [Mogibacterium sp.]